MEKKKIQFYLFLSFVLLIVLVAVFAPYIATHDPNEAILKNATKAPDGEHLFGTDRMGRDLFSRVVYGTRTSLYSTFALVSSILIIGGAMGILAGYFGGKVDTIIMRFADMMVAFPGMALAIAIAGVMGPSITNAVIAITVVSWTKYARLARSLVLKMKHEDFVKAAFMSGTKTGKVLLRYFLPTIVPMLVITAATDMGGMMLELAGFSFLGLGAQSNSIEWGFMLNEGRAYMGSAYWLMFYPGLAIFITVVAFNLLGDSIRDLLDPQNAHHLLKRKNKKIKKETLECQKI